MYKVITSIPPGYILRPLLWNIMYDRVPRLPILDSASTTGFVDNLATVVDGKTLKKAVGECDDIVHSLLA